MLAGTLEPWWLTGTLSLGDSRALTLRLGVERRRKALCGDAETLAFVASTLKGKNRMGCCLGG